MRYAQLKGGRKLHLVYEPGEGFRYGWQIPLNTISAPLCGTHFFAGSYRMTINAPLGHACKNCIRVNNSRRLKEISK
jgi:hypothetical protein